MGGAFHAPYFAAFGPWQTLGGWEEPLLTFHAPEHGFLPHPHDTDEHEDETERYRDNVANGELVAPV